MKESPQGDFFIYKTLLFEFYIIYNMAVEILKEVKEWKEYSN